MERSDTLSIFVNELNSNILNVENPSFHTQFDSTDFDNIIQNSSFHDRFDSTEIREIIDSSGDPSDSSGSLVLWKKLDANVDSDESITQENDLYQFDTIPAKKVVEVDALDVSEDDDYQVPLKEDYDGTVQFIHGNALDNSLAGNPSIPSLSLQPWKGKYNFDIKVETSAMYANSKWAFSTLLKKLFLKPFDAVPIELNLYPWLTDSYINITPVFTLSQHNSSPVNRCLNHKMKDRENNLPYFEHIVQVDNEDAKYREDGSRFSVDIPLGDPAPGEVSKLVYIKCGCWNTCVGGPNRKPFCLVFTLFSKSGAEIGRQILDLKVCACPVRDCGYTEKKFLSKKQQSPGKNISKSKSSVGKNVHPPVRGTKRIKIEDPEHRVEYIAVPVEISDEVKKFINRIMAEKFAKENNFCPPFPNL